MDATAISARVPELATSSVMHARAKIPRCSFTSSEFAGARLSPFRVNSLASNKPRPAPVLVSASMKRNPKRLKYAGGSRQANDVDVVTVDPLGSDASWKLKGIADLIKEGAVGLIPTDTVYALVCDVKNRDAIDRLYRYALDSLKP
ncbi:unnamed protein product [Closterium sp. NIES-54]